MNRPSASGLLSFAAALAFAACTNDPIIEDTNPEPSPGSGKDSSAPQGPCGPNGILAYTRPGCGDDALPSCVSDTVYLCLQLACSCDGQKIGGCNSFSVPYRELLSDPNAECPPVVSTTPTPDASITPAEEIDGGGCPDGQACEPDAGVAPSEDVDGGGCPTGQVWVTSWATYSDFLPFCGQPCATTSDCPSGSHCVSLFAASDPEQGPVCVSATNPPPVANPMPGWHWDTTSSCRDADTLALRYNEPTNRVGGLELIACPDGCVPWSDAGVSVHCR